MDGLSLAASIIAVIQLAGSCLKLSRKFLGPSEFGSSDLNSMTTALYGFNGAVKSFQTHLEIYEDDEARLSSLEYLKPVLKQCGEALHIIEDFMGKSGFIGKHVIGLRFDFKLKTSLKALEGAKELFTLALHADQRTILSGVERYIRNIVEDLREIHDVVKNNKKKLDVLDKEQSKYFKQASDWQEGTADSLKRIREGGDITYEEVMRVRREQEDCQRQTILDWITPIDYASQQHDFIARRQQGTGQWLLNSDEFQTWLNTDKQTLFCPGIPGAGKTILTAIVINDLTTRFQNDPGVGIAYLYYNFRRKDEQKAQDLLATILKQLSEQRSSLPDSVQSLYNKHKEKGTRPPLNEILRILQSIASTYSRVFIIVDAIDECQVSDGCRTMFLTEIFNLQTKTRANLFATSRFIPDITERFNGSTMLEIRAHDEDVRQYLDGRILQSGLKLLETHREEIKTEITKAVNGMFLLAQLHFQAVSTKKTLKKIKDVLKILPTGPKAYDYAYEEAMKRIAGHDKDSEELAKQVLSWITYSKRPLSTCELQHALAVEVTKAELDKENLPQLEDMISVCAGLVTVDEESNIIRLVHYTTQEYFERTKNAWFPKAESEITTTCVTYLSFNVFSSGYYQTDNEFKNRLQSNRLYDYASHNWGHHAREASTLCQGVMKFLQKQAQVEASSQWLAEKMDSPLQRLASQRSPKHITGLHLVAYFGVKAVVTLLLDQGAEFEAEDSNGQTPLLWAVQSGYKDVVTLLLDRDAKLETKDKYGRTPLSYATKNGHEAVVTLLLDRGAELETKDESSWTPLSLATKNGHEAIVTLLLDRGAELETKDESSWTPLSLAAKNGHEAIVTLLLDRGAELETKDESGRTPLWHAAENKREAIVRLLHDRGAELETKDESGRTPLLCAAKNGHEGITQLLLEYNADVESKDDFGRTPLSWAGGNGHGNIIQLLLTHNYIDINAKDKGGSTALFYAFDGGHQKISDQLREKGASIKELDVKFDLITPTLFRFQGNAGWVYFHERR